MQILDININRWIDNKAKRSQLLNIFSFFSKAFLLTAHVLAFVNLCVYVILHLAQDWIKTSSNWSNFTLGLVCHITSACVLNNYWTFSRKLNLQISRLVTMTLSDRSFKSTLTDLNSCPCRSDLQNRCSYNSDKVLQLGLFWTQFAVSAFRESLALYCIVSLWEI